MSGDDRRFEDLSSDVREYMGLKTDELKLKAVEGLSVGVGRVFAFLVILMVLAIVLAAFAFGSVLLLGELTGSQAAAAFIVGGVFLVLLAVLYLLRNRLFVNIFVKLFIGIFYGDE